MKHQAISSTLIKMANHKHLRKILTKRIDDYIYKNMVDDDSEDLEQVQLRRSQFLSAMLHSSLTSQYPATGGLRNVNTAPCAPRSVTASFQEMQLSGILAEP